MSLVISWSTTTSCYPTAFYILASAVGYYLYYSATKKPQKRSRGVVALCKVASAVATTETIIPAGNRAKIASRGISSIQVCRHKVYDTIHRSEAAVFGEDLLLRAPIVPSAGSFLRALL